MGAAVALTLLCLVWVAVTLAAALTAWLRRPRLPGTPRALTGSSVLFLRPCAGDEPNLAVTLGSSTRVRCTATLHHRFVLAHTDDSAMPQVRATVAALQAQGASADIQICPPLGPNRKVSQLHGGLSAPLPHDALPAGLLLHDRPELVLCCDSDVDLAGIDLDLLLSPLTQPGGPAATWALPVEAAPRTTGDRASAAVLGGSLHAFPLLCGIDPQGLVGKTFAVRRDALMATGGFLDLVHHLGEDMELARRLVATGHAVQPVALVVPSLAGGRSLGQVVQRFSRWLLVIRAQRPWLLLSYPLILAPLPGQLLLLLAVAAVFPPALWVAVAAVVARGLVCGLARQRSGLPLHPAAIVVDILWGDLVLLMAWLRALGSNRLSWRGVALRIDGDGRLVEDD